MAENFEHGWKESNKLGHVSAPRDIESRGRILNLQVYVWGNNFHSLGERDASVAFRQRIGAYRSIHSFVYQV
jgi:hypothetical protein